MFTSIKKLIDKWSHQHNWELVGHSHETHVNWYGTIDNITSRRRYTVAVYKCKGSECGSMKELEHDGWIEFKKEDTI